MAVSTAAVARVSLAAAMAAMLLDLKGCRQFDRQGAAPLLQAHACHQVGVLASDLEEGADGAAAVVAREVRQHAGVEEQADPAVRGRAVVGLGEVESQVVGAAAAGTEAAAEAEAEAEAAAAAVLAVAMAVVALVAERAVAALGAVAAAEAMAEVAVVGVTVVEAMAAARAAAEGLVEAVATAALVGLQEWEAGTQVEGVGKTLAEEVEEIPG
jgi:hypothetical protein